MKAEHKAIISRARKEGMAPSEVASELLLHDLVQASINQLSKHEVGFRKMSEKQQDVVIAELQTELKASALLAARLIAGANTATVEMTLKDLKVSNGQVTGVVKSTEEHYNELISKVQDKSDVLIVLYERDYFDALDGIQSEKDQKALDLDSEHEPEQAPAATKKPRGGTKKAGDAAKPIEIPPKLLEDARAFVVGQQNATYAGLQNKLSIGLQKAERIFELLAEEGVVKFVGDAKDGQYELVRDPAPTAEANESGLALEENTDSAPTGSDAPEPITELTEDLYDRIAAKTREKGSAAAAALAISFDISLEIAEQAFDRMELEGVIDAEGNLSPDETFPVMD
jgi:S-DNA-T family DNA segregation ATPase FtsK/SpoIIIE